MAYIEKDKYCFDKEATSEYYESKKYSYCKCIYCDNYVLTLVIVEPELVDLLESFGLYYEKPLEVMDYVTEETNVVMYYAYYSVKGVLYEDEYTLFENEKFRITLFQEESEKILYPHVDIEQPYFTLEIVGLYLPWILGGVYPN